MYKLKLTDMGCTVRDTVAKASASVKETTYSVYYKNEVVKTSSGSSLSMYSGSLSLIKYTSLGLLAYGATSLSIQYGNELIETDFYVTASFTLKKITMSNSAVANILHDETTLYSYLTGVFSNDTTENITIKYIGLGSPTAYIGGYINWGVLSYIELDEPITLAPGEDYPFKISLNYGA